jgi:tetratricopeptide (TPR) repeat protein
MANPAIFVSYSWKSESKTVVDEIQVALKTENIEIQRDINVLNYKGKITEFMNLIGRGKIIILVIGKDYLESENCLYELMQIASQGDIYERIVPVYLPSADIHKISLRVKYIQFWTDKNKEIESLPSNILMNMPKEDVILYRDISQKIGDLMQFLASINALSVEIHQEKKWKDLIDTVKGMVEKLGEEESVLQNVTNPKPNIHKGDNVNRDKIKEQINTATYIKHQTNITYGEKKIPAYLTMPPMNTQVFEGRETALQEVHDKLFGGNNLLMLVNGQGGIGKTTFAAKYWLQYEHKYTHLGVLYVGNGIANELLRLATVLQIIFPEQMPDNQRLEVLFTEVTALNKPCLLILDNANNGEDLGKYAVALSKCINFHILLTSRLENFAMAKTFPLPHLDKTAALKVFQQNYTYYETTDETLFYEIFLAVGGNTLVMELLAKNLNNFNRNKQHYSLQKLHEDLKKSLLNLSKSKEVHTAYQAQGTGLRNEKPEVIMLAMYDLSELSEAEIALLSAFAVLPPENIAFASLETLLKSETLEDSLEKLAQKGWIEFDKATKSYKVSPVVQEITRYKNKERLFGDCEGMIEVLANKLNWRDNPNYDKDNYKLITLYSYYAESIITTYLATFQDLPSSYNMCIICEGIGYFHETTGNLGKALNFYTKYTKIAEQLVGQNSNNHDYKNLLAISYQNLGITYSSLGSLEKALLFYEKYNKLEQELHNDFPNNSNFKNLLAISYQYLGLTHSNLGSLDKTLMFYETYNKLEQELCDTYPMNLDFKNNLASSYSKLGEAHNALNNFNEALEFYEKDIELAKELYAAYPTNMSFKNGLAISYSKLGEIYSNLGSLDKALEFYIAYNKLKEELYATNPINVSFKNGLAISYQYLGTTHSRLGNLDKALEFYTAYNTLEQELYTANPTNVSFKNLLAISYGKLGDFYENTDKQKAKFYYLECKKHYVELVKISPDYVEFQKNLELVENRLAGL